MSRWRSRRNIGRNPRGEPKFKQENKVGDFTILHYMGHSRINKRNAQRMAKAQHWYRCVCTCGTEESRSQQELIDPRRQQKCFKCRPNHEELEC